MAFDAPLYLHFFDRELGEAVEFRPDAALVRNTINCLLIATSSPLYCGLSPVWETSYSLEGICDLLHLLTRDGHLWLLSSHPTTDEFIAAKVRSYEHDFQRYPMYFHEATGPLAALRPTVGKATSATNSLQSSLIDWSESAPEQLKSILSDKSDRKKFRKIVRDGIAKAEQKAITFALFRNRLERLQASPMLCGHLRREISALYSDHYRQSRSGEIPTGIPGLSAFDGLCHFFPFYDVPLLGDILEHLSAARLAAAHTFDEFLAIRGGPAHLLFTDRISVLIAGICSHLRLQRPIAPEQSTRWRLRQNATRILANSGRRIEPTRTAEHMLFAITMWLNAAIERARARPGFAIGAEEMEDTQGRTSQSKVLLVVATAVEHAAVIAAGTNAGLPPAERKYIGDHTYFLLGCLGGCDLWLVRCEAGSGGVSGSTPTVMDAARDVQPSSIIVVGIAFGLKPREQALCDVLISKQMMAYDHKRVSEATPGDIHRTPRGDRSSASPRLYDRFWSGSRDWDLAKTHFGVLLSGDSLVDSATLKAELLALEPEAIGGEMEGAGAYVAASKHKIDWIIVKAIVDWGENKSKEHQVPAARNAVDLVFHVIRQGGLAQAN